LTTYAFAPPVGGIFTFNPTLDGAIYSASVTWNLFGQRWYININQTNGPLIVCKPLVSSDEAAPINLLSGYFTTSVMYFFADSQTIVVTP
jgi:hypothetical protein